MAGLKVKADLQATCGLAAILKRREESVTTEHEEGGRQAADSRRLHDWIERFISTRLELIFLKKKRCENCIPVLSQQVLQIFGTQLGGDSAPAENRTRI